MLVSRSGGLSDLVEDERAVIQPDDATSFAGAVYDVLTDVALRRKLEKDTRRLSSQLSWDGIADTTAALYRKLAGRKDLLVALPGPADTREVADLEVA